MNFNNATKRPALLRLAEVCAVPNRIKVTSADFIRNVGYWQNEAIRNPVSITHHGRERLILTTPDQFLPQGAVDPRDIERALEPLRETQSILFENMDEMAFEFDEELRIQLVNRAAQNGCRRPMDELVGSTIFDALPQPLALVGADYVRRALRSRRQQTFSASGSDGFTFSAKVLPRAAGAALLIRNNSEEENLRQELVAARALQQALSSQDRITFASIDNRGRIVELSRSFCQWLGFEDRELLGYRLADIVDGLNRREMTTAIETTLRDGESSRLAVTILGRKGEPLSCEISIAATRVDGAITGACCLFVARDEEQTVAAE